MSEPCAIDARDAASRLGISVFDLEHGLRRAAQANLNEYAEYITTGWARTLHPDARLSTVREIVLAANACNAASTEDYERQKEIELAEMRERDEAKEKRK